MYKIKQIFIVVMISLVFFSCSKPDNLDETLEFEKEIIEDELKYQVGDVVVLDNDSEVMILGRHALLDGEDYNYIGCYYSETLLSDKGLIGFDEDIIKKLRVCKYTKINISNNTVFEPGTIVYIGEKDKYSKAIIVANDIVRDSDKKSFDYLAYPYPNGFSGVEKNIFLNAKDNKIIAAFKCELDGYVEKEEIEKLPIGTVVLLKGGTKKIMIIGTDVIRTTDGKTYDYLACLYPEGFGGEKYNVFFNSDSISEIYEHRFVKQK